MNMNDFRKLVYEDKETLNDFRVDLKDSLNYHIYIHWLLNRQEIDPFDPKHRHYYLKSFNDAYYVCTTALLLPQGKMLRPEVLINNIGNPSIVFPLVYLYLSLLVDKSVGITLFLQQL